MNIFDLRYKQLQFLADVKPEWMKEHRPEYYQISDEIMELLDLHEVSSWTCG